MRQRDVLLLGDTLGDVGDDQATGLGDKNAHHEPGRSFEGRAIMKTESEWIGKGSGVLTALRPACTHVELN